jgi:hypothetical protein
MKITRTAFTLSLSLGFALALSACGMETAGDTGAAEESVGEIDQEMMCTDCGGGGDYPDFGDYRGPVGGLVDYGGTAYAVSYIGPSACNCDSGECPVKNRYNRWICVGC